MKIEQSTSIILCAATLIVGSLFAQSSDCPPCSKDQPASSGKACCGALEYDPETHECCGDKIVEKGKCCRKSGTPTEFNPESQCCETAGVFSKDNPIQNLDDCPNRAPRPSYNPWNDVNGCSTPINIDQWFNADFTPACNSHDACYGTCNSDKSACDLSFYSGMMNICDRIFGTSDIFSDCKIVGAGYYYAVVFFGKSHYDDAQKIGCQCCK